MNKYIRILVLKTNTVSTLNKSKIDVIGYLKHKRERNMIRSNLLLFFLAQMEKRLFVC